MCMLRVCGVADRTLTVFSPCFLSVLPNSFPAKSLLIEKPANPIAFIIEYLYKQYPDQAKAALDSLSGGNAAAASVS